MDATGGRYRTGEPRGLALDRRAFDTLPCVWCAGQFIAAAAFPGDARSVSGATAL